MGLLRGGSPLRRAGSVLPERGATSGGTDKSTEEECSILNRATV